MNSENLKTFILLAENLNFSKTAALLFVAQSTVTKRIAELENEIGKPLFFRDKKHVLITKEGNAFLSYAKRITQLEAASIKEVNSLIQYKQYLRIGSTNSIYDCHLFPLISMYDQNPDNSIKVTIGHSSELINLLKDDILDIVFSFLPLKKCGYECSNFHSDQLVLVTSYNNKEFANGITKCKLTSINYLMCNFALEEIGQYIQELFPAHYQFKFEIDNSTKIIPYLLSGYGYSFLPISMINNYVLENKLRIIPLIDFESPVINSYYIFKTSNKDLCSSFMNYS